MSDAPKSRAELLNSGLRFECQGSGRCCTSRGGHGYVYLSLTDRRRLALFLSLPTATFTRRKCEKSEGLFHLTAPDADCRFLEAGRCSVYEARPEQCRAWPFWEENLDPEIWARDVASFCPGVGQGPTVEPARIREIAARSDTRDYD